jgi:hypothetical protein
VRKRISILVLLVSAGTFQSVVALERTRLGLVQENEFSFLTGLEYQQGDYGTPYTTTLWSIPFNLSYRKENYSFFASLPLLYAQSDGTINVSSKTTMRKKNAPPSTTTSGQQSASGIGDVVLSGSYYFMPDYRKEITYRVTGTIKLGTADESDGLGTGENDFFLEGGAVKNIDEYILSGTLGYEISGDSPVYEYNDVFYGNLGLTKQLEKNQQMGASLYFSQALTDNTSAPLEISFFYRRPVSKGRDIYLYVSKGLSDGSPDIAAGGSMQFYF